MHKEAEKITLELSQAKDLGAKGREMHRAVKAGSMIFNFQYHICHVITTCTLCYFFGFVFHEQEKIEELRDEDRNVERAKNLGQDAKGDFLTLQAGTIQPFGISIIIMILFH